MRIVKVPGINAFGKTQGTERAGDALIEELENLYTNEKGMPIDVGGLGIAEIEIDKEDLEKQAKTIQVESLREIEANQKVIFLGGDHSISYSIGKSFLQNCRENREEPCLIVFDSHPDCMPVLKEPSHEEWLRALIEEGFPAENILLIGIRNSDEIELKYIKEKKIRVISINNLNNDIEGVTDAITEFSKGRALYVSFDIDVVDPVFAPSTGYCEIGGLSSRQAVYIMSRLSLVKNLKILDIVEINSEQDLKKERITIKLGAKILGEFL